MLFSFAQFLLCFQLSSLFQIFPQTDIFPVFPLSNLFVVLHKPLHMPSQPQTPPTQPTIAAQLPTSFPLWIHQCPEESDLILISSICSMMILTSGALLKASGKRLIFKIHEAQLQKLSVTLLKKTEIQRVSTR